VTTRLILVRHGQTDAAVEGRTQGRIDNPLNALGRRQAEAVAARLIEYAPGAIYSSPAARARATAEPLARALDLRVALDPRLLEMDYGSLDDRTSAQMREREPAFMERWASADPADLRIPGGETLREVQVRVVAAAAAVVAAHPDQAVVLCSHNFALRMLVCHALGLPFEAFRSFRIDLASYSVLECREDGAFLVVLLNEVCHLQG
jgi:broad specificity phosphatase PhoE